jgi:3-oxoacyl-[acyl-carrier-protein] synthase-3
VATLFNPYQAIGLPQGLDIDSEQLFASFLGLDTRAVQWLKEHDTDPAELGLVCVHQPSVPFVRSVSERLGIRPDTVVPTFPRTGNVAAATIPLQLALAGEQDRLHPGMKIALFGMASGAGAAVMLINWTASVPGLSEPPTC